MISKLWLNSAFLFDPIQALFNGNFWGVFEKKFRSYTKGRVLDIACGTGELRRHIKPTYYLGLDINHSYIKHNKENLRLPNTEFMASDASKNLPAQQFDTVFLISAIHHLTDIQLNKIFRTLSKAPPKMFIVVDGYPKKPFTKTLWWLDAKLAGGDYFRMHNEIASLASKYFKIKEKGTFEAERSFYQYPYVVMEAK